MYQYLIPARVPIYLSIYLSLCLSISLSVCLSIHLSVYLSVYLSAYGKSLLLKIVKFTEQFKNDDVMYYLRWRRSSARRDF